MRPSCATCRFSHSRPARNPRARDKEIVTCRRWPPQADSAPWGGQARAVFPRVFPEDWCGEWQEDVEVSIRRQGQLAGWEER